MSSKAFKVNRLIKAKEVRVIDDQGQQLGIFQLPDAVKLAEERGLDLVEISAKADPPVCKVTDAGRFKYEMKKKEQAAKKNQSRTEIKEVKVRPGTDTHDLEFKLRHIRRFLEEGNKVKLSVYFRGREMAHTDIGVKVLQSIYDELAEQCQIDQQPKMEGRSMTMVVSIKH